MLKKLIINSAVFGIAPYLPRVLSVALLPILTTYLSEIDYGIIGTVTAYTTALYALATLGLTQIFFNSYYHYKYQYKWLWKQLYAFLQLWIFAFAIIQGVIIYFVIPEEAASNRFLITILNSLSLAFTATSLVGSTYYQLKQTPLPIAIRTVVGGLISILINYYLVVIQGLSYMGFFWASCISSVLINVSYLPFTYKRFKPIFRFKYRTIKRSLKVSLPIIPHTYSAYLLNTSNRLVMDIFKVPINSIGEFNMSQQFSNLMDAFTGAINQAINPMTLNELREERYQNVKRLVYIYFSLTLFVTFLFSLWSREIFYILITNENLRQTYPYAILMIMAQNAKPMYVASSNIYFYYESTMNLLKITFVTGILALIGYIITIPLWGIWGAVIVYYLSMLYMGYAGFCFSFYKNRVNYYIPIKYFFLISTLLTVFAFYFVEFSLIHKIIISLFFMIPLGLFVIKKKLYRV